MSFRRLAAAVEFVTGKVFVVDQGNSRVLIWNKIPSNNGVPADLVLGQKDFYSREANAGMGQKRCDAASMYFPTDVVYGRKGLFVSDSGNNRVLVWKELPTENGQPADLVIGQSTFTGHKFNRGGEPSECNLNDPYGMFLEEDPEDEEDSGRLYICDRGNSRLVIWDELPDSNKDGKHEEIDHPAIEDPELLMGRDDDFMDDEEEDEEAPKELA